ncbi:MAG TPA: hypothetical protein VK465_04195 [Fibrobacteria bacterium]|nr:hypothetical protein [Fibrobacteria bacterium]
MKSYILFLALALGSLGTTWAGKQKIIVRLREPLRAEQVKIRMPEVKSARGETRDLETLLDLGGKREDVDAKSAEVVLKLNMEVRSTGKGAVQVTLTLPEAGYVEVAIMDFYGKHLATLLSGTLAAGVHPLKPFIFKDGDNNGIKFMTLKLNGKMAMKRVMTKVR